MIDNMPYISVWDLDSHDDGKTNALVIPTGRIPHLCCGDGDSSSSQGI